MEPINKLGNEKPPSCEFYNIKYCPPCPEHYYDCDLVKIGNQIRIDKWKPSEQDYSERIKNIAKSSSEGFRCLNRELGIVQQKIKKLVDILIKHIQLESSDPDLLNYVDKEDYNDDLITRLKK